MKPITTKLETQQFNCFHVSSEDFKALEALPVGTELYTADQLRQQVEHWKRRALTPTTDQLRQAKAAVLERVAAEFASNLCHTWTGESAASWVRGLK